MTPRTALAHKKAVFPRMNARVFRPAAGALCALMLTAAAAHAQPLATPAAMTIAPPQNVLQLSANGQVEVQQDLLTLSLTTSREGADAAGVQAELRKALDAALAQVKTSAQPGQMDVRTGDFNVHPSYNRGGKISGWQGTAELVLEGKDFPRIAATAGKIQGMAVGQVSFGLSREERNRVASQARSQAIEKFKSEASDIAREFGFSAFTLREVSVNGSDGMEVRPRMMAMSAKASMASDAPIPVEAGKSTVVVNVSGSVQMR